MLTVCAKMEEPSPLDAEFDGLRDILEEEASWRRCAAELHEQQQEYIALLAGLPPTTPQPQASSSTTPPQTQTTTASSWATRSPNTAHHIPPPRSGGGIAETPGGTSADDRAAALERALGEAREAHAETLRRARRREQELEDQVAPQAARHLLSVPRQPLALPDQPPPPTAHPLLPKGCLRAPLLLLRPQSLHRPLQHSPHRGARA